MSKGLGRGLDSLIPKKINQSIASSNSPVADILVGENDQNRVLQINPADIEVNPFQPRQRFDDSHLEELIDSIREFGIIQPLIVTKKKDKYELIAGERRLRSARALKLDKVPAIIREADEQEKLEIALIENIQRENLNPVETAISYKKLIDDFNLSQEEMAKKVGKSRSSISNTLRVLSLPEEIQLALIEGKISEGHAKVLLSLATPEKQMALFRKITINQLSVMSTSKESKVMGAAKNIPVKINYEDKNKELLFREFFKTKVEIKRKRSGGQVIISFYSDEELNEMLEKIK